MGNYNWHKETSNLKRKNIRQTMKKKMNGDSVAESLAMMITKGESTIQRV